MAAQDEPFIKITEEDGGKPEITKTYADFQPRPRLEDVKPRLVIAFFWTMFVISLLFCAVFLFMLLFHQEIPDYFIGFIGAIIGLFFAKRPDEI